MSDEGNGHRIIIGPRGMKRNISREEAAEYIASASLQVGQKIYDEITKENERLFAMMKAEIDELRTKVTELVNGPGAVHGIMPLATRDKSPD